MLRVDDLQRKIGKQDNETSNKPEVIMESKTDSAEWKLEVERVLPQLKITIRADNKVSFKELIKESDDLKLLVNIVLLNFIFTC